MTGPSIRAAHPRRPGWWLVALSVLLLVIRACSGLRAVSATETGCQDNDMVISHEQDGPGEETWTVTCKGRVWDCARGKEPFEATAWDGGTLQGRYLVGTRTGETYCLQR